ncbi:DUF2569 family protein [Burkholderia pyrrocinia]
MKHIFNKVGIETGDRKRAGPWLILIMVHLILYIGTNLAWNLPRALQIRLDPEQWSKLQGATWHYSDIPADWMFYFQSANHVLMTIFGIAVVYWFISRSRMFPFAMMAYLGVQIIFNLLFLSAYLNIQNWGDVDRINNVSGFLWIFWGEIEILYLASSRRVKEVFMPPIPAA